MRRVAAALAVAGLFVASAAVDAAAQGAYGQQGQQGQTQQRERTAADRDKNELSRGLKPGTVKASDLIGKNVEDSTNRNVGEVKDLLIDKNGNRVAYVIFDPAANLFQETTAPRAGASATGAGPSGTQGGAANAPAQAAGDEFRDKYLAIPWGQFKLSEDKLLLSADREKLKNAPSFAQDRFPEDSAWFGDVDKHYGQSASRGKDQAARSGEKFLRAGEFLKMNVRNPQNEKLGAIEEIVIDMSSGRVLYAVLGAGGFLGIGEKLFAIPVNAFTIDTAGKELVLQADKERLKQAQGFDKGSWPTTASRDWTPGSQDRQGRQGDDKKS
jgi:sporulation protein YlmC with PRC-barrel domain